MAGSLHGSNYTAAATDGTLATSFNGKPKASASGDRLPPRPADAFGLPLNESMVIAGPSLALACKIRGQSPHAFRSGNLRRIAKICLRPANVEKMVLRQLCRKESRHSRFTG